MEGVREALWHAGKTILWCSLVSCPLDFLCTSPIDTHTHICMKTSRISSPSFQFCHLFSITGAFERGPPAPRSPRTARLSDKTPQTLLHYEAMIGGAAWSNAHKTAHTHHMQTHMYTLTEEMHKEIYTHASPASLSSVFSHRCMSCMFSS